jgi:CxC2 like cysteine cluster associated with KDZ transposases
MIKVWPQKTPNDFLLEWIPWRSTYLSTLLALEASPGPHLPCMDCSIHEGSFRCLSCLGNHVWCHSCALKAHGLLPFHRLQQWNGKFYEAVALRDLGFTLNLGHNGDLCPLNTGQDRSKSSSNQFTVVDCGGVFIHTIKWCKCHASEDDDRHLQLLQSGLFPSTISRPQTAFTFDVLDGFLVEELECKTSAYSFYSKLRRLTCPAFPDSVPVGGYVIYCELN